MAKKSQIEALFTTILQFDTKGKKVTESKFRKIAKSVSKEQGRKFVCSKIRKNNSEVIGILVSTRKEARLSKEQKSIARNMCVR